MSDIFLKIVQGKLDCYKVAEDKNHLAFLDISPLQEGHVLVIPKQKIDYLFDMESEEYLLLWTFARKVAKGMKKVFLCDRIGVSVVGLEVPHVHIHLLPINQISDMNFEKSRIKLSHQRMKEISNLINKAI